MANNVINWAVEQSCSPSEKLILFLLANRAHRDGTGARPGLQRLMDESCLSRRAVQAALDGLESRGLIQAMAYRKGGHGRSTQWRCCIEVGAEQLPQPKKNSARRAPLRVTESDGTEVMYDPATGTVEPVNSATPAPFNSADSAKNSAASPPNNSAAAAPQPKEPLEPCREDDAVELLVRELGAEIVDHARGPS